MEDFIEEFRHESHELISKLEHNLIEYDTKAPIGVIEENFRHMHSIKGAAGMFGFAKTEKITHLLETVYDEIRESKLRLNDAIVHISLQAIDMIRRLIDTGEQIDEGEYQNQLDAIASLKVIDAEHVHEQQESVEDERNIYYFVFEPDKDSFKRGANPFSVIEEIEELGPHLILENNNGKTQAEQENEKIVSSSWDVFVISCKGKEDLEDAFLFFAEDEFQIFTLDEDLNGEASADEMCQKRTGKPLAEFKPQLKHLVCPDASEDDVLGDDDDGAGLVVGDEVAADEMQALNLGQADNSFIKVSSEKLDLMMNLVSDLVTTYSEIKLQSEAVNDTALNNSIKKLEKLSKSFRDNALEIRLVSIKALFQQMKRLVFDLSKKLGKDVRFISDGLDTELDKTIIKALESPLMHILRNSIDHGIESEEERLAAHKDPDGLIKFVSFYSGSYVIIQIQDDGRGIDIEKVKAKAISKGLIDQYENLTDKDILALIFEPGFSTADEVSLVSGRGVGMDVVKKELAKIRAEVEITTEKGLGTSVTLKMPVTLSIVDTLLISVAKMLFLLSLNEIEFCFKEETRVIYSRESNHIIFENKLVPFIRLRDILHIEGESPKEERVIIVNRNGQKTAIICDRIIDEHQAVIKPLGPLFNEQEYFSGGSVLGDGRLAIILDTGKLIEKDKSTRHRRKQAPVR